MGTRAVVAPTLRLDEAARERLGELGLTLHVDGEATTGLADAVARAATAGVLVAVAPRDTDPRAWRRNGVARLAAATNAAASSSMASPAFVVVLPATSPTRSGPVVVLSPAGSVSSYELYLAAGMAAASGRRVVHLNGRSAPGSVHASLPARAAARGAPRGWQEHAEPSPERALRALDARPAVIVAPVVPGAADVAPIIDDHPDADLVLVFDAAHARHGTTIAHQVASMVELALAVQLGRDPDDPIRAVDPPPPRPRTATETAHPELPAIRASDVVHVRLTGTAIELTNRTRQRLRVRIGLGSAAEPDRIRAEVAMPLEAETARAVAIGDLPALAPLAPPTAVVRHWSHGDAEVFEGGEQRIMHVDVAVVGAASSVLATRAYDVPNGLDFSVTARELSALLGRARTTPALPEPAPLAPTTAASDLLATFESALAVGRTALAKTARAT